MKPTSFAAIFFFAIIADASSAELPPLLKPQAEAYDAAIKQYDASVSAQTKIARDAYLAVLSAARKREDAAKRPGGVAAIDAELAAVNAGPLPDKRPDALPADLATHRERFLAATSRAALATAGPRKNAADRYLSWLAKTEAAVKGKDNVLTTAIEAEKKRVLESAPTEKAPAR